MFAEALWLLSGKVLFFVVVVFSSARLAVERKLLYTVCVVVQLFRDIGVIAKTGLYCLNRCLLEGYQLAFVWFCVVETGTSVLPFLCENLEV